MNSATVRVLALVVAHAAGLLRGQLPPEPPPSPVPELLAMLQSDVPAIRREAAGRLGADAGRWHRGPMLSIAKMPLLRVAATDADAGVAQTAMVALWRIGTALPLLGALLTEERTAWRRDGAATGTLDAIEDAVKDPVRIWRDDALLEPLLQIAEAGPARHGALAVLAVLGPDAAPAIPRLRTLLAKVADSERWRVAMVLAACGEVPALPKGLEDPDDQLRLAVALAHQRSASKQLPAGAVVPWVTDARASVQLFAIAALPRVTDVPAAALAAVAERLDDELFATTVVACLETLGPRAAKAAPTLLRLLATNAQGMSYRVPPLLGAMGPAASECVDDLVAFALATKDEGANGYHVGQALARIAPARALPRLLEAMREETERDTDRPWPSASALAGMGATTAGEIGFFMNLLEHPSVHARRNTLRVLAAMGPGALPALPHVLRRLEGRDDEVPDLGAVIRNLGPAATATALPVIEKRLATEPRDYFRLHLLLAVTNMGAAVEPRLLATIADPRNDGAEAAASALVASPQLSEAAARRIGEVLDVAEGKEWGSFAPWRPFQRPLTDALANGTAMAPTLTKVLSARLEHPDFPVHCAAARLRMRDLCPALAGHPCIEALLAASSRDATRQALVDRASLAAWVRSLCRNQETAARALGMLPLLGEDEAAANIALAAERLVDAGGEIQFAALQTLGAFGPRAHSALPQMATVAAAIDPRLEYWLAVALEAIRRVRGR